MKYFVSGFVVIAIFSYAAIVNIPETSQAYGQVLIIRSSTSYARG